MAEILAFGAHPDDVEFGMGASIVKFARSGLSVAICVLTRGEAGTFGTAEQREKEMRNAASKVGAAIDVLEFQDCRVFDTFDARVALAAAIRRHRPHIIFAPYHANPASHTDGAAHPDHTATGLIVKSAARYARFAGLKEVPGEPWNAEHLIYYMVPRSLKPNLLNDVSEYIEDWEAVARCHVSQMSLRNGQVLENLRKYRQSYGTTAGVAYAEAFFTEEPILFDVQLFLGKGVKPGGASTVGTRKAQTED